MVEARLVRQGVQDNPHTRAVSSWRCTCPPLAAASERAGPPAAEACAMRCGSPGDPAVAAASCRSKSRWRLRHHDRSGRRQALDRRAVVRAGEVGHPRLEREIAGGRRSRPPSAARAGRWDAMRRFVHGSVACATETLSSGRRRAGMRPRPKRTSAPALTLGHAQIVDETE